MHIETTSLADGTYELIQESDEEFPKTPANIVELIEALNSDSEEPKSTDFIDTTKGKPRCITPIILNYAIWRVHLSYWSWMKILDA